MSTRPPEEEEDPEFWLWVTAHHEAAHAVAYWQQDMSFRYVTIRPRRGDAAGQVVLWGARRARPSSLSFIAAAGPIAEAWCTFTPLSDDQLGRIFREVADDEDGDGQGDFDAFARAVSWMPSAAWLPMWRGHEQFVTGKLWPAVEAVANALLDSTRALTFREVDRICSPLVYLEGIAS